MVRNLMNRRSSPAVDHSSPVYHHSGLGYPGPRAALYSPLAAGHFPTAAFFSSATQSGETAANNSSGSSSSGGGSNNNNSGSSPTTAPMGGGRGYHPPPHAMFMGLAAGPNSMTSFAPRKRGAAGIRGLGNTRTSVENKSTKSYKWKSLISLLGKCFSATLAHAELVKKR